METTSGRPSDRTFWIINALLSTAALSFLGWLLLAHRASGTSTVDLRFVPALNACLNGSVAALLLAGRVAIRKGRADVHRALMVAAFLASVVFLVGYLAYHAAHGDTKFGGAGAVKAVYLLILATHVVLSAVVVPLALAAFYYAFKKNFVTHKKVTRVLHPVWVYVAVTGVVIFLMLRPYYGVG